MRRRDAAVNLVGRDMHETRCLMRARRFEQRERAPQIGLKHRRRGKNTAVHVRFRREVYDDIRLHFRDRLIHQCGVARYRRAQSDSGNRWPPALDSPGSRTSQFVEIHHYARHAAPPGRTMQPVNPAASAHKCAADEAGASRGEEFHFVLQLPIVGDGALIVGECGLRPADCKGSWSHRSACPLVRRITL